MKCKILMAFVDSVSMQPTAKQDVLQKDALSFSYPYASGGNYLRYEENPSMNRSYRKLCIGRNSLKTDAGIFYCGN